MKGNGNLADLALGVASDEKDVITFPQSQSSSSPVRGQLCDPRVQLRSARRSYSRYTGFRSLESQNRWEVTKPPQGLWPELLQDWGLTAPKTYQSHFWHVKEEYVWAVRVARYRRDMYRGFHLGA